jgi:malate dehydrogenase (oxaloacetate-decarboxylating)(NADP+)
MANIREASIEVAVHVAELIFDRGLARVPRPADVASFVRAKVYEPASLGA